MSNKVPETEEERDLKRLYTVALHWVADLGSDLKSFEVVSGPERLELYGLREVVLKGPCTTDGPRYSWSAIDTVKCLFFIHLANWGAWRDCGQITPQQAMKIFIQKTIIYLKRGTQTKKVKELLKILERKRIQLFGNILSPATRSILWFCYLSNVLIEFRSIPLPHENPNQKPAQKIPWIEDDGFVVSGSPTITRYLTEAYDLHKKKFIPQSLQDQTKVDIYLEWHTTLARISELTEFYLHPIHTDQIEKISSVSSILEELERDWFPNGDWVAGTDNFTVADLFCFSELKQIEDWGNFDLKKFQKLNSFLSKMKNFDGYEEIHSSFFELLTERNQVKSEIQRSAKL